MWWIAGSTANLVIAVAYLAIAWAIVRPLHRTGQLLTNRLGTATAAIFFRAGVAVYYWSLRRVYGTLLDGAKLFDDLKEREPGG